MKCAACNAPTARHAWYCFRCQLAGKAVTPKLTIGISGKAKHGKTSVAETMATELTSHGLTCLSRTVSDEVLTYLHESREINRTYDRKYADTTNGSWVLKKLIEEGRKGRAKDEDMWLDRLVRFYLATRVQRDKTEGVTDRADVFIINGLRFPNELRWVEQAEGMTVLVVREGFVSGDRPADDDMETSLDGCIVDYEIHWREGQGAWLKGQAAALVRSVLL